MLFRIEYQPVDAGQVPRLRSDLLSVAPKLSRWGAFREGISIRVEPDHAALEAAAERRGYPWLHAWAYGDEILLESPRHFGEVELSELLAHELTHALMFQLMAPGGVGWVGAADPPPVWFREGMASVTADQGYRRMSTEAVLRWCEGHPGVNLLHPAPEVYRNEREAVYAAAHRTFELLLKLVGDGGVRDILRAVSEGKEFPQAFAQVTGHRLVDFEREAIRARFDPAAPPFSGAGG